MASCRETSSGGWISPATTGPVVPASVGGALGVVVGAAGSARGGVCTGCVSIGFATGGFCGVNAATLTGSGSGLAATGSTAAAFGGEGGKARVGFGFAWVVATTGSAAVLGAVFCGAGAGSATAGD